jgi:hypothetical protein
VRRTYEKNKEYKDQGILSRDQPGKICSESLYLGDECSYRVNTEITIVIIMKVPVLKNL